MRSCSISMCLIAITGLLVPAHAQVSDSGTMEDAATMATQDVPVSMTDTLQDAITSAYARNPSILAQRKARLIADESLTQARSSRLPQVGLTSSAGFQRTRTNRGFASNSVDTYSLNEQVANLGVNARQSVYTGGRVAAGIGQAEAGVDLAQSQLLSAEQNLLLDVISAYVDVRTSEAEVNIRRNNVSVLKKQVQAARDRFNVGEVTRTDVAQAEARQSGAEAQLATSQSLLEANRAFYKEIVGRLPVQLADTPDAPVRPEIVDEALEAAIAFNPDLQAAKAASEAAEQRMKAARGELRPNLSVVGSAGVSQTYNDTSFESENASLLAELSIPLYQGGLLSSRLRSAKLERDQFRLQAKAIERNLVANVARTWYATIAAERAIEASVRQVEAAEIAFDGAEQELAVGLRTTLDVLDQEQELLEARLGLVRARRDAYLAVHQLLATMGQLTPKTLGVNVPL